MSLSSSEIVEYKLRAAGFKILAGFSLIIFFTVLGSQPPNIGIALSFPVIWFCLAVIAILRPTYRNIMVKIWVLTTTPLAPLLVYANGLLPASMVSIATILPLMLARGWWRTVPLLSIALCTFIVPFSAVPYEYDIWVRLCVTNIAVAAMAYALIHYLEKALVESTCHTFALKEALNEANEARKTQSNFLSTMSHEIRTPMNGILGLVDSVLENKISEQERSKLELVRRSGEILNRILNDILDLSKMSAGKMVLEKIPTNFHQLVDDVISTYATNARNKQIELRAEMDPVLTQCHLCDPTRVTQILNNLVSNAIKFTNEGSVQLCFTVIENGENEQQVKILVEDTGQGMASHKLCRIFEPYLQANESDARNFGGTGLGLQIVKFLIEAMESEIFVESTEGQGSKFWFTLVLPKASPSIIVEQEPKGAKTTLKGTVLVVDDNEINRIVVKEMLSEHYINALFAKNGREAVEATISNKFELILMDLNMPEMDGYQATSKIREAGDKTPIVALSASVLPEEVERAMNAGVNQHLAKPINKQELTLILKTYLG